MASSSLIIASMRRPRPEPFGRPRRAGAFAARAFEAPRFLLVLPFGLPARRLAGALAAAAAFGLFLLPFGRPGRRLPVVAADVAAAVVASAAGCEADFFLGISGSLPIRIFDF